MKKLDSIPAKVFIKLGDEYAYNYDDPQDAYMNGYIGFDYAIPYCHYDLLNANKDFKKSIMTHEVLKPYVEQGYVLDTIDFDRMETGMPVIVLNLVESSEEPEEKDEIVTVEFVFENEKGEYVSSSDFVSLNFNMNNLDASVQLLNSQIAKAQKNDYELSSEKHTWYSKDKTLYWNLIFEQSVGKTYTLYFDKVVQDEPEPEEPEPEPEPNPTVSVDVDIDLPAETLTLTQTASNGLVVITATDSSDKEYSVYEWSIDGLSFEGEGNKLKISPLDLRWTPGDVYNIKLMAKDKNGIWHAYVIQVEVTQQMLVIG